MASREKIMYNVTNEPDADRDINKAADWYESQQSRLGEKFLDDLENMYHSKNIIKQVLKTSL